MIGIRMKNVRSSIGLQTQVLKTNKLSYYVNKLVHNHDKYCYSHTLSTVEMINVDEEWDGWPVISGEVAIDDYRVIYYIPCHNQPKVQHNSVYVPLGLYKWSIIRSRPMSHYPDLNLSFLRSLNTNLDSHDALYEVPIVILEGKIQEYSCK